MDGQRIGYIRVSTVDQHTERQLEGIEVDKPLWTKHQAKIPNDRNLDDLRQIVQTLTGKGVRIEFVKEHLFFTGEDSPMAKLMLSVMGAVHEFERALIKERQREGIAMAKKRGVFRGRKKSLSQAEVAELRQRITDGMSKTQVAREFGISRETLYKYLKEAESTPVA